MRVGRAALSLVATLPSTAWARQIWPVKDPVAAGWLVATVGMVAAAVTLPWLLRRSARRCRPDPGVADLLTSEGARRILSDLLGGLEDLVLVLDRQWTLRLYHEPAAFAPIAAAPLAVGQRLDEAGLPDDLLVGLEREIAHLFERGGGTRAYRLDPPSGGRAFEIRLAPLRESGGDLVAATAVVRDLTDELVEERVRARWRAFDQELMRVAIGFFGLPRAEHDAAVRRALERTGGFLGADRGYLVLIDEGAGRLHPVHAWTAAGWAPAFAERPSLPLSLFPAWLRQLREQPGICIPRVAEMSPSWALEWTLLETQGVQSLIVAPLREGERLVGFVGFEALGMARSWSDEELQRLRVLADLFAGLHRHHREDDERAATEVQYREAIDDIQEIVFQTDAAGRWTFLNPAWERITGYPVVKALGRQALELVHPADRRFRFLPFKPLLRREADHCRHELRCITRDGGVRWLEVYVRLRLGPQDEAVGTYGTLMDITERKLAEEEIRQLAFFDPLTGLPNRRLLLDRLQQALAGSHRTRQHGALLFIDLDNFKTLNDSRGHHMGDLLLQQVASRLRSCVRQTDTVSRFGGDEFVVMLTNLSAASEQAAAQVAVAGEKIRSALGLPYELGGGLHRSTPSIGATLFFGHEWSIQELLKRADVAMYQAKAAGRNLLRFYDASIQARHLSRMHQVNDLPGALRRGELHLLYQPQLDDRGRVLGAEALLRWRHPRRGTITAAELIPRAIESGLILPLGRWVMEQACARLASWAVDPDLAHLTLAVNVSLQQLQQPDFIAELHAILQETGADPRRLRLELSERACLGDIDAIAAKLYALKGHGVGLALDDFGVGPGSLLSLQRLPLDQLKMDPSFARAMPHDRDMAAVARTIVAIGQTMGVTVVAEGVERADQRRGLIKAGCRGFQGHLFSRPVPRGILKARLRALGWPTRAA